MPENMTFVKKKELLSYEEMLRIAKVLAKEGVNKIRITGGEPFLRKDIIYLLKELTETEGIEKVAITSNATLTAKYLDELLSMGIQSFNISIDSLDKERFYEVTRRDVFDDVMACIQEMMNRDLDLRLNCVVMDGKNIEDILPFIEMTGENKVSVRFIEEMPFNGDQSLPTLEWNYLRIIEHIQSQYPEIEKLQDPKYSTSMNYKVKGHRGSFGVIPAFTRSFCGSCNRIRITAQGLFKTCLYDQGVFNIRDFMRNGATDAQVLDIIKQALSMKSKDGYEAERNRSHHVSESMSTIGG